MKRGKAQLKKQMAIQHREERYQHAIQKVIDGKADPNYATLRWEKLREVKGHGR